MGLTVSSPDGNRWYVRRVWLPWRPRWRRPRADSTDLNLVDPSGCLDDTVGAVVAIVAGVVLAVLFVIFVVPVLITLFEVALVLLLAAAGAMARIVLRRPWVVEATPATGSGCFRWKVVGWRRSGEVVDEVARRLAAGERPLSVPGAEPC
ncbi:MAG TPA: hypothetical protein VHF47_10400 [Acidimicrobiales bacterium]|nr:hypothetical protein [Acidimicrobiales bacterium]